MINANSQKDLAKLRAETKALVEVKQAEAYKAEAEAEADNEAAIIRDNAQTRLDTARARCAALIKEADAETRNANNMEGIRRHAEKIGAAEALLITG